jgi:hypothetical protein
MKDHMVQYEKCKPHGYRVPKPSQPQSKYATTTCIHNFLINLQKLKLSYFQINVDQVVMMMISPQNSVLMGWQFLHSNHIPLIALEKIWPKLIWDHPKAYKIENDCINTKCVKNYINAENLNYNKQT